MDVRKLLVLLLISLGLLPVCAGATVRYTITDLGTTAGGMNCATAINDKGQIVGWVNTPINDHYFSRQAFIYDGVMHEIGSLGGDYTTPCIINNNGHVVGESRTAAGESHAFLYDGTMHDLGWLSEWLDSDATAINDNGLVVGWAEVPGVDSLEYRAFIHDGTAMLDLNNLIDPASGWILYQANDINNQGQIVGYGSRGAFLLTPVPEPSSLACLGVAFALLGGVFGTRKRWRVGLTILAVMSSLFVLVGAVLANVVGSEPGIAAPSVMGLLSVTTIPPEGYTYLPAFPRFLWSQGCLPTSGAMCVGYYSNAGFPRMCKKKEGSTYTDYICPTGNYPCDNGIYLKAGEPVNKYPSRCAISATEKGVFGRTEKGHVDDYFYYAPFGDLAQANASNYLLGTYDEYCKVLGGTPQSHDLQSHPGMLADSADPFGTRQLWIYQAADHCDSNAGSGGERPVRPWMP